MNNVIDLSSLLEKATARELAKWRPTAPSATSDSSLRVRVEPSRLNPSVQRPAVPSAAPAKTHR